MSLILIVLVLLTTNNANYARQCNRVPRDDAASQEEATTTDVSVTLSSDSKEQKESIIKSKDTESAAKFISIVSKQAPDSHKPFNDVRSSKTGLVKAYACSKLECADGDKIAPVCACNFNTGNVASFKNKCDSQKHNCRFDTSFKVILDEICPWEFAFRRSKAYEFDYRDPKYYN